MYYQFKLKYHSLPTKARGSGNQKSVKDQRCQQDKESEDHRESMARLVSVRGIVPCRCHTGSGNNKRHRDIAMSLIILPHKTTLGLSLMTMQLM